MRKISTLPCGAKIRFGSYAVGNEGAHSIRWIKVNEEDTTLLAEHIEDFRAFDAKELENTDNYRREYGNNRYSVSNIDQFLNSVEDFWFNKRHENDAPPTDELTYDNTPYDDRPGFLAYFNTAEVESIIPTEIKVALPECDDDENKSETITRSVFLPSLANIFGKRVRNITEDRQWDCFKNGMSTVATPTQEAVSNTTLGDSPQTGRGWYWWLRSPDAGNSCCARYVDRDGDDYFAYAYRGFIGVRPALKINPEILVTDNADDDGYFDVILSGIKTEDVSEDDFFSILMG